MTLAPYVRILGRGPGRSRNLTLDEAQEAMALILNGTAEPEAVGALLMLMRFRGETPDEIAGFVRAVTDTLPEWTGARPDLDWPSYAAGRTRGLPWFLLSARVVARAGVRVLLHGWNSHQSDGASVRDALSHVGITSITDWREASATLDRDGIAYAPLEVISPRVLDILRLRDVLGLRSCVNTVCRVMNPAGAAHAVQGVFHPPYLTLQAEAGAVLGLRHLSVIKGGGGEFERNPAKIGQVHGLRDGEPWQDTLPELRDETRRLAETETPRDPAYLGAVWDGTHDDPFAVDIVLGTAALTLETAGVAQAGAGYDLAQQIWRDRH